jgi:hypothetical protein
MRTRWYDRPWGNNLVLFGFVIVGLLVGLLIFSLGQCHLQPP